VFDVWYLLAVYKLIWGLTTVKKKPNVMQARSKWGTENSVTHIDLTSQYMLRRDFFPINLCGWWNFPSPTCLLSASCLAFVTVYCHHEEVVDFFYSELYCILLVLSIVVDDRYLFAVDQLIGGQSYYYHRGIGPNMTYFLQNMGRVLPIPNQRFREPTASPTTRQTTDGGCSTTVCR
jgi:hypothetical protein